MDTMVRMFSGKQYNRGTLTEAIVFIGTLSIMAFTFQIIFFNLIVPVISGATH